MTTTESTTESTTETGAATNEEPSQRRTYHQRYSQRRRDERVRRDGYWYAPNAPRHGTHAAYGNWHCRCPECQAAQAKYDEWRRERQRERVQAVPGNARALRKGNPIALPIGIAHGTAYAYELSCRCRACYEWKRDYDRARIEERRNALVEVDGVLVTPLETPHGHGHYKTYRGWYCRCRPCTDANRAEARKTRERRVANELRLWRVERELADGAGE